MTLKAICNREVLIAHAQPHSTALEAAQLMRDYRVGTVVVTEERNGLRYSVGIVTLDDLIDLIADRLKDLAGLIGKQQNLEKKYR